MATKILLTLLLIAVALMLLRLLARAGQRRRARVMARAEVTGAPRIEDMRQCPTCGTYVPARRPRSCGRTDCPY
jgi:hypothetical protein